MCPQPLLQGVSSVAIKSPQVGGEYVVSVASDIGDSHPKQRPLLIVLDAPYIFCTVVETARLQEMGGEIGCPLIVGIGTAGGIPKHALQRLKDFTPPQSDSHLAGIGPVGGMLSALAKETGRTVGDLLGGAEVFLDFLCDDVLKYITSRYAIDEKDIALFGHSAGAVFCHYTFLRRPEIFRRMIIGSLGTGWYGEDLSELESALLSSTSQRPLSVFQGVGARELEHAVFGPCLQGGLDAMDKLAIALPDKLNLTQAVLAEETHCSVMAPLAAAGVRTLYGTGASFMDAL